MKILPLSEIPFSSLVTCFNEAFAGYFVPFVVTEELLRWKHEGAGVDYDLSAGVLDNGQLVAFVVNGIGEWNGYKTAYNGGTGVIPDYRGKRLTSAIYDFLEPKFKAAEIEQCTLEVIMKNDKAVKVYEHIGFEVVRGFNCFAGSLKRELRPLKAPFSIRTRKDCDWDNWEKYWEYKPSWENSKEAINRNLDSYIIEELMDDDKGIGYIIFHPKSGRISQMGVDKTYRNKGFGKQLLKRVMQHNSNVSINNVESNAWAMLSFLQKCGFKNPINQYEMKKMING